METWLHVGEQVDTKPRDKEPGDLLAPVNAQPAALMRGLNFVPMALRSRGRFGRGRIRFMLRGSLQSRAAIAKKLKGHGGAPL